MKYNVESGNVENINDGFGTSTVPILARFQFFKLANETIKLVQIIKSSDHKILLYY